MIKINQIRIPVFDNQDLKYKVCTLLKIKESDILNINIVKKSLDARKKPNLFYVYEVDVKVKDESILSNSHNITFVEEISYNPVFNPDIKIKHRPIVVGAGPAGLFSAYMLAKYYLQPIIIEQGMAMEDRIKEVENFWKTGILNPSTNIQFGEGGAGTFSDGKLNTSVKDKNQLHKEVLKIFIECGAPEEIMYLNKPHIGTDLLRNIIINMRKKIISMGGTFRFNTKLTDISIINNEVTSIIVNNNEVLDTSILVLAIGHSARDTYLLLNNKKVNMLPKPFAVGLRVQHNQDLIDLNQYGQNNKLLPKADYKLTSNHDNRGVYSFCMCPGGYVVNASSEEGRLTINGMSNHNRNSGVANSAIVVSVSPEDYGKGLFAGLNFQKELEEKAFKLCNGKIPTQLYKDFKNNKKTEVLGNLKPMVKGKYAFANLRTILPSFIADAFIMGMESFGKQIQGFNDDNTVLMGIESRTSSPIRISRDEEYISNIRNIYPIGEGAGYAGGIMTASVDGIRAAEKILNTYKM